MELNLLCDRQLSFSIRMTQKHEKLRHLLLNSWKLLFVMFVLMMINYGRRIQVVS